MLKSDLHKRKLLEEENKIYQMILDNQDISSIDINQYDESMKNTINYIVTQEKYIAKTNEGSIVDNKEQHNLSALSKIADNDEKISEIDNSIKRQRIFWVIKYFVQKLMDM